MQQARSAQEDEFEQGTAPLEPGMRLDFSQQVPFDHEPVGYPVPGSSHQETLDQHPMQPPMPQSGQHGQFHPEAIQSPSDLAGFPAIQEARELSRNQQLQQPMDFNVPSSFIRYMNGDPTVSEEDG